MKKIFCLFVLTSMVAGAANAAPRAIPWWDQPTVCRANPSQCYTAMGAGYDSQAWDANAGCRGVKLICANATKNNKDDAEPVPMGQREIRSGDNIDADYDVNILVGDCFGARKTNMNSAMALVNGEYMPVWCRGVLANVTESVENGEIGPMSTCDALSDDGYVAVVKNKCWGKFYDPTQYFIDCAATTGANAIPAPKRIIILNGADYTTGKTDNPIDMDAANKLFDIMQKVSADQRTKYFTSEQK